MELPDNIIRHYLRDVYFISGSACGGKSTIAKYLSAKYGITLYNWDEKYTEHKKISDAAHQPFMNKNYGSWEEYFSRPPDEYAEAIRRSINEQVEIAVVELISMATKGGIVVDGIFPCHVLKRISGSGRVIFLMADMEAVRSDYFSRSDNEDMLECLNGLQNPQQAIENVFLSIEHSLSRDFDEVRASGFRWIMRDQKPDWDGIRQMVERHFQFTE